MFNKGKIWLFQGNICGMVLDTFDLPEIPQIKVKIYLAEFKRGVN